MQNEEQEQKKICRLTVEWWGFVPWYAYPGCSPLMSMIYQNRPSPWSVLAREPIMLTTALIILSNESAAEHYLRCNPEVVLGSLPIEPC
jgi:hypothetical protein